MTPVEDRIERLEAEMDHLRPSLHERLARLEQAAEAAKQVGATGRKTGVIAAAKGFVRWMGAELPKFLTALILLWFGWGIKDSVDLSIKQRQLDLSYAKEMQGLLQGMGEGGASKTKLESTAVLLASYGAPALPALLSELTEGGLREDAAIKGIRTVALRQPAAVCEALPPVLSNRAQQFGWLAQRKVITLLGENDCTEAIAPLADYRAAIVAAKEGNPAAFQQVVKELPLSPAEAYPDLLKEIDRSLARLELTASRWAALGRLSR
jgi:hypothetical protein